MLHPPVGPDDPYIAAQLFKPERLTLARELRQLTKADLAGLVEKSPSAISQFEADKTPDGSTLAALSLALGVPVSFFTVPMPTGTLSIEQCQFRSLRSASQRERRSVIARGTLLCELVDALSEDFDFPPTNVPQLDREVVSRADIERAATETRARWGLGLGPIANVVWILEGAGVVVATIPSDVERVDAFSGWRRSAKSVRPFVFLASTKESSSRARFDAAHELGHLVMHVDAEPGARELEKQADQFGSSFLLPEATFAREAPRRLSWPLIWELKRRWGVSARAILYRAHELGVLSDASYRRGFMVLNQQYGRSEPHEPPQEAPALVSDALASLDGSEVEEAAGRMGLRACDLRRLMGVG